MKIAVLTHGSRGDVEPYLAIAAGLQRRGHRVTVVAPPKYAAWIRSYGVDASPLVFDSSEFLLNRPPLSLPWPRWASAGAITAPEGAPSLPGSNRISAIITPRPRGRI